MDRYTGTTMKPIYNISQCPYINDSGNTTPSTNCWPFSALLLYFQLGRVPDLSVWCNITVS